MERETERGERLIEVSRPILMEFLKDSPGYETNVPGDAELEELWHHEQGYGYVFRVSSTEWDTLDEGEPIPEFEATVTTHDPLEA